MKNTLLDAVRRLWLALVCRLSAIKSHTTAKQSDADSHITNRNRIYLKMVKWIEAHMTTRRNTLLNETEWAWRGETDYQPFNKATYNTIWHRMMNDGVGAYLGDMKAYFGQLDHTAVDPVRNFVAALPQWDGHDRLTPLAHRLTHEAVCVETFGVWMRGMMAMMMHHGYETWANNLMPILIGAQGAGKTRLCRQLLPWQGRYFCEDFQLSRDQNHRKRMATNVLVCIDELDRLTARQTALLKNILSQEKLEQQEGYTHARLVQRRAASFIATTNETEVLTDLSGSRRFVCIPVEGDVDHSTPIDYTQLYAQLRDEVMAGKPYYPDHELEQRLEQHNSRFYRPNQVAELMAKHYEMVPYGTEGATRVYCNELFETLRQQHSSSMREYSVTRFGRVMATLALRTSQTKGMELNSVRGRDSKGHWYSLKPVA